jgi:CMP-N-acetylneuraminic acid synthetase
MILGVIPARKGSKGIENKNIYPLCGKPLIEYTIETALKSNLDEVIISTDMSKEIFNISDIPCKYVDRPKDLCADTTPMLPVIKHLLHGLPYIVDAVMILQPTSPLRTTEDINIAIKLFNDNNVDSLYSVYSMSIKHKNKTYDKHIDKPHLQRNGAIFITRRDLLAQNKLWSNNAIEFIMPSYRSIDIDSMEDMRHAELLLKGGVLND